MSISGGMIRQIKDLMAGNFQERNWHFDAPRLYLSIHDAYSVETGRYCYYFESGLFSDKDPLDGGKGYA